MKFDNATAYLASAVEEPVQTHSDPRFVSRLTKSTLALVMAAARAIGQAAPDRLVYPVEGNELFLKMGADEAARLRAQGFDFYDWGPGEIRLVTSWDQQGEAVDTLAAAIRSL